MGMPKENKPNETNSNENDPETSISLNLGLNYSNTEELKRGEETLLKSLENL